MGFASATGDVCSVDSSGAPMWKKAFWIGLPIFVWVLATALYWVGYTGEDDLFYARYAYLFHRPPILWWEFRMSAILAMRGSFLIFGPSEFAAVLPSLLASVAVMTSVAWFVGWPRILTWQSHSAMLLAALLPIDVGFRSYPSANQISTGFLALGTVCILKGTRRTPVVGAALLAVGFLTHEISLFYVALFCLTLLAFDAKRFGRAVAWCVAFSACLMAAEMIAYAIVLGEPLARLKTAAAAPDDLGSIGRESVRFYIWPIQNLVVGKHFGFDLAALLATAVPAWRRLEREQQILVVATLGLFFWLGYGSMVPWQYKPLAREFHFYNCLTLGAAALLPFTLSHALGDRQFLGKAVIGSALAVHVLSLAGTGRWGADVDVSRELLQHARQHPDQRFLTDVNTMNQMYVLSGFRIPDNVACLNGEAVELHLLLNKEPPGSPFYRFPDEHVDAVLVNRDRTSLQGFEPEFLDYLRAHGGRRATIAAVRYRPVFAPVMPWVGTRDFMIRSEGGELVSVTSASAMGVAPATDINR